jgi:excisionase family DNA binding protein
MTSTSKKELKLISLKEAARILSTHPETLRRWDNSGKLKAVRVGSRKDRQYKPADIINILETK